MNNHNRTLALVAIAGAVTIGAAAQAQAPTGRFVVGTAPTSAGQTGVAIVFDTRTKLTWERGVSGPTASPGVSHCHDLELFETESIGWRVPTVKELLTLIDYAGDTGPRALVDEVAFPSTPASPFWSATTSPASPLQCVDFTQGWLGCGEVNYTRCVH